MKHPRIRRKPSCKEHGPSERAECGGNPRHVWCFGCDPGPAALCPWCHGRGYSLAPLQIKEKETPTP